MPRSLEGRVSQAQRCRGEVMRGKRMLETAEQTQERLEAARQYKKARRSLQCGLDLHEAAASANRLAQHLATDTRNKANQLAPVHTLRSRDEVRFFAEIDKPLSKICAVCGEHVPPDSVKTIPYSSSTPLFKSLAVTTSSGPSRGLVAAGVYHDGVREQVAMCARCDSALARGQIPRFSIASGFQLPTVPDCLALLNPMEARMIGLGVCFTTCFTLGPLGQTATRGNAINFWNDAYDVVSKLPRPADRCGVIQLKNPSSRQSSSYYQVRPWLLREALVWLIAHNPIYSHVLIDEDLLETMPTDPEVPTVDLDPDESELEKNNDDEDDDDCEHGETVCTEEPFAESFVLEHPVETQREDDNIVAMLEGCNGEEAFIAPRYDRPMNEYTTKLLMQSCFPTLFPHGLGGFHPIEDVETRRTDYKLADYCSHLMAWHDRRFIIHPTFKFFCLNLIQRRQIDGLVKQVCHRTSAHNDVSDCERDGADRQATQPATPVHNVSKYLKELKPFFRSVRGTGLYWANVRNDLMAMIGSPALENPWPTFFVTLSAADTVWPDFFRVCDPALSFQQAADLSPTQKRRYLNENPDLAARHFHRRFQAFFKYILCGKAKPLGEIIDWFWRIEFQRRGSPHVHALFWVKDAPDILELSKTAAGIDRLVEFADNFVSCWRGSPPVSPTDLPEGDPLCRRPPPASSVEQRRVDLVSVVQRVQLHVCCPRSSCRRDGLCRFGYPKDLQETTTVQRDESRGGVRIRFDHKRDDPGTNNYNPALLSTWRANIDVKIIGNAYGAAEYTAAYVSKAEPDSVRFKRTIEAALSKLPNGVPHTRLLHRTAAAVLAIREVSAQEAVYILSNNLCLYGKSRTVLKLKVSRHDRRFYRVDVARSDGAPPTVTAPGVVRMESIELAYMRRPHLPAFEDLAFRDFCEQYECSVQRPAETQHLQRWELIGGGSYIKERKQRQVVRPSPRFRTNEEDADYCYSQLFLHKPWRELADLPSGDERVCSEYRTWRDQGSSPWVQHVEATISREAIIHASRNDDIVLPAPEWSFPSPGNLGAAPPGSQPPICTYVSKLQYSDDDISRAKRFLQDVVRPFTKRAVGHEIENLYSNLLPTLYPTEDQSPCMTEDQWRPFALWMQQSRRRIQEVTELRPCPQLQMIVSGEGGTGKSWLIQQIIQDLRIVFGREEATKRILLMAHQGSAAFLIGGRTLTSALGLPSLGRNVFQRDYVPLLSIPGQSTLRRLQGELQHVQLIVIDEYGVISCGMLHWIDKRLREIFPGHGDKPFGGRDILFTGDPSQLGPVSPSALSTPAEKLMSDVERKGRKLWESVPLFFILRQQNRGTADPEWYDALRHVREGSVDDQDLHVINSRVLRPPRSRATNLSFLAYRNVDVDRANDEALRLLQQPICTITARHDAQLRTPRSGSREVDDATRTTLIEEAREIVTNSAKFLPLQINLVEGVPVVLTFNLEQRAGLCNGSKGEVYDIIPDDRSSSHLPIVLVRMRDYKGPSFLPTVPQIVPITTRTVMLTSAKDGPYRLSRTAVPLRLGFATTIHKIQGQTCTGVVFDPTRLKNSSLAYVALSRVRQRSDMFITSALTLPQLRKTPEARERDDTETARVMVLESNSRIVSDRALPHMKMIAALHNASSVASMQ